MTNSLNVSHLIITINLSNSTRIMLIIMTTVFITNQIIIKLIITHPSVVIFITSILTLNILFVISNPLVIVVVIIVH